MERKKQRKMLRIRREVGKENEKEIKSLTDSKWTRRRRMRKKMATENQLMRIKHENEKKNKTQRKMNGKM